MIETVFDTLNAKAAICAIESEFERAGARVPVMISARSPTRAAVHFVGPDTRSILDLDRACATAHRGAQLRARRRAACDPTSNSLRMSASCYVSVHPNAGLPNEFGGYDQSPEHMAQLIGEFARSGSRQSGWRLLRNDAGAHRSDPRSRCEARPRTLPNRTSRCVSPDSNRCDRRVDRCS